TELHGSSRQRDDAMTAVGAVADVVHEDHAEVGTLAHWLGQQTSVHVGVSAGLEHEPAPQFIAVLCEPFAPREDLVARHSRNAAGYDTERLSSRVHLDGTDGSCEFHGEVGSLSANVARPRMRA